ncbi:hypothetical protein LIX60_30785 [Streptomyces sp. S07_1.15]|uniref:type II toxin-antitoxin system RelE family toxin n=1 Tax=Streptomyces sp. S07_1.15 TaxID=2873925 RepID=UPI001D14F378|nr:hypothetical protein [Streptomyces sp. S07_1.15]MCC3655769.1 hypothetical protein [Streptomyces sp. S07_1.15]
MYRLKFDPSAEVVFDSLPPHVSEELTLALADACYDPLGATRSYGEADDVMRTVVTEHAQVVLLVGHTLKTITVLQVGHLG